VCVGRGSGGEEPPPPGNLLDLVTGDLPAGDLGRHCVCPCWLRPMFPPRSHCPHWGRIRTSRFCNLTHRRVDLPGRACTPITGNWHEDQGCHCACCRTAA